MDHKYAKHLDELRSQFDDAHDGCEFERKEDRMAAGILAVYCAGRDAGREEAYQASFVNFRRCYARDIFKVFCADLDVHTVSMNTLEAVAGIAWSALDAFETVSDKREHK